MPQDRYASRDRLHLDPAVVRWWAAATWPTGWSRWISGRLAAQLSVVVQPLDINGQQPDLGFRPCLVVGSNKCPLCRLDWPVIHRSSLSLGALSADVEHEVEDVQQHRISEQLL